ncbi:hypothetical protein CAPTEDRAFT_192149 [Capitella teleta]|uniref:G-protein coupled receptors family 1 profile domain-containing protein n=1 Tax=Capitella teleta TaxID=283909 RepID=R7V904_CAPTE|nr:hypothetical protein CAPTEDRAFT_192149 [Capitella teleta]|eukprot:ELU15054.1 hypothetical protein CAPTEDRAFT_192149 [Capitella teleta]
MEASTAAIEGAADEQPVSLIKDWYIGVLIYIYIINIIGVPSNILLMVAYIKHPELQSPTNILIVNQGFADLMSLLLIQLYGWLNYTTAGLEFTMQNKYLCLFCVCTLFLGAWSSLFNLLALSIDRITAIQFPFLYARVVNELLVKKLLTLLWIFMISLLSLPIFGLNTWRPGIPCTSSNVLRKEYLVNFFLLSSFLVLLTVAVTNIWICGIVINKRRVQPSGEETQQNKSQFKLTKMMLIVVGLFYLCWLPYTIVTLILVTSRSWLFPGGVPEGVMVINEFSKVVVITNGAINPAIYAWKSSTFRRAFRKTLHLPIQEVSVASGAGRNL